MNAHFTYWTNLDLIALVLNLLYKKDADTEETSDGDKKKPELTTP
jgi:hypothetical protein